jgi:acyl-CoA synthetase (AMP-forming)/AMP-acid ligase II
MILRSGENIYPIEVEQRLDAHPLVLESAVVGQDHPVHGQEVKAIVVVDPDADVSVDDLSRFAGETLSSYKVPTVWERRSRSPQRLRQLKTVLLSEAEAPTE